MAAYPTAWGFSSLKSPKKGVEVEALMKSGALGLPHPAPTPPWLSVVLPPQVPSPASFVTFSKSHQMEQQPEARYTLGPQVGFHN